MGNSKSSVSNAAPKSSQNVIVIQSPIELTNDLVEPIPDAVPPSTSPPEASTCGDHEVPKTSFVNAEGFKNILEIGPLTELSGEVPAEPEKVTAEPEKFSPEPDKISPEPENVPAEPEKIPTEPEKLPPEPGQVPTEPEKVPKEPVKFPTAPDKDLTTPVKAPIELVKIPAEPVKENAESVKPSTEPVKLSTQPVKATTEPVKATTEPVKATTEPVKATAEPVKATAEPVKATAEPVKATAEPVKIPAEPLKATIEPEKVPMKGDPIQSNVYLSSTPTASMKTTPSLSHATNSSSVTQSASKSSLSWDSMVNTSVMGTGTMSRNLSILEPANSAPNLIPPSRTLPWREAEDFRQPLDWIPETGGALPPKSARNLMVSRSAPLLSNSEQWFGAEQMDETLYNILFHTPMPVPDGMLVSVPEEDHEYWGVLHFHGLEAARDLIRKRRDDEDKKLKKKRLVL